MARRKQRRPKHIPQRTCVACRQKVDKRRLLRIVRTSDEGVVVDPSGKRNGRGAYLCDQSACWDRALDDKRLLDRALMVEISETDREAIAFHRPGAV
jgi:predicted RNA-binding protein YlxR (DUF448 family)